MSAKSIRVVSICRTAANGPDILDLKPGVNVIVGLKDTGKTGWLQTISFLLGDTDTPEKSMRTAVAARFDSAALRLLVAGEEVTIERRWKEPGAKGKLFVNGEGVSSGDFSEIFLKRLGIPVIRIPKGNPYASATWPQLSWRMLFRHIYREERFWSDLADKQPEKEQHACILQFLGVADRLFPSELGESIEQRKRLLVLQARKEQFEDVLKQAARDLVSDPSVSNAPTLDAIAQGEQRIRGEIEQHHRRRAAVLANVVAAEGKARPEFTDTGLGERRVVLAATRERLRSEQVALERRSTELSTYRDVVRAELGRLKRAAAAGELFKPLTVRCCPHCDQSVSPKSAAPGQCFVCQQPLPAEEPHGAPQQRVAFEEEQLLGEESELNELLPRLQREQAEKLTELRAVDAEIAEVEVLLRPMRVALAAVLPPEIGALDTKIGQLEEKIAQLSRLRTAVGHRDELTRQIDQLGATVQGLTSEVDAKSAAIPFEQLSDILSDGINEYLNLLRRDDPSRWMHDPIRFDVSERSFKMRVGKAPWSSLGATSQGYVALGYHYALLKLSGLPGFNYPGLALIDFPMTLADGSTIGDKENFLIEPFTVLAATNTNVQVVVCGRAFIGLKNAHRIELTRVWRPGEFEPGADEQAKD